MKKSILFLGAALISAGISAQKKPKINQAENSWRDGDLVLAKEIVDAGIEHEKTKDDTKTWFVRGLVYSAIDSSSNPEFSKLDPNAIKIAVESFNKASQLQKGDNENFVANPNGFPILQSQVVDGLWAYNLNTGISTFQDNNPAGAIDYFEKAQLLRPDSIDAFYFAGLAGIGAEQFDRALGFFKTYIEKEGDDEDAYIRAAYILNDEQKKPEEALKIIKAARTKFPDSKSVTEWNFKILFALDMIDEAIEELRAASIKDPSNAELNLNLAIMLEQAKKPEEAEKEYLKAIEKDPNLYGSRYNLAALYTNQMLDIIKEKNNLGISKDDQAKAKEYDVQIKKLVTEVLPHWEKVNELEPDDKNTLQSLQYLYIQVKDYDKAEAVAKRMEELGFK